MIQQRTTWLRRLVVVAVVFVGTLVGTGGIAHALLLGDVNGDGVVNGLDVDPLVEVVVVGPYSEAADLNEDGVANGLDLPWLAEILWGSPPPFGEPPIGGNVFFSTVGTVGDGVRSGHATVEHDITDGSGRLYIWSTDDQSFYWSIGMNVLSQTSGVIAFTSADIFNPELLSNAFDPPSPLGMPRWQGLAVNDVTADAILRINAANLYEGTGILSRNDGGFPPVRPLDPLYDIDAGAFLLGTVQYDIVAPGVTHLSIDQEGTALFVHDYLPFHLSPDFGTATIRVMPEVPPVLGDVNMDGNVNGLDVDPFVDRIVRETFQFEADLNEDGWVNGLDVDPFVTMTISGGAAPGSVVVPEPWTVLSVILGLICIMAIRRQQSGPSGSGCQGENANTGQRQCGPRPSPA